jgi:hypothetical protein
MYLLEKSGRQNKSSRILKLFIILVFTTFVFCQLAGAESDLPGTESVTHPKSLSLELHYGTPFHIWSDRLYSNFQLATLSLTYEKESGLWPFTSNKELTKSFLLEFRLSHIWGKDIELDQDQVSQETWDRAKQEGRNPTVDWDHYQIALIPYYRFYYPLSKEIRIFFEGGFGFSLLNKPLIEDGTAWNFIISGGLGLDFKFKTPFYTFLKLEHFSNGGDANLGITDKRVVGPESLVFGIGMRFPL